MTKLLLISALTCAASWAATITGGGVTIVYSGDTVEQFGNGASLSGPGLTVSASETSGVGLFAAPYCLVFGPTCTYNFSRMFEQTHFNFTVTDNGTVYDANGYTLDVFMALTGPTVVAPITTIPAGPLNTPPVAHTVMFPSTPITASGFYQVTNSDGDIVSSGAFDNLTGTAAGSFEDFNDGRRYRGAVAYSFAALITDTPEPSSLIPLGLGVLIGARRLLRTKPPVA